MSRSTYFVQECPTCGRSLHVRVEYLGRRVACQHCRREFVATDAEHAGDAVTDSSLALLRRADQLIEMAEQRRHTPR